MITLLSLALALLLTLLYFDQPDANVGFRLPEPLYTHAVGTDSVGRVVDRR